MFQNTQQPQENNQNHHESHEIESESKRDVFESMLRGENMDAQAEILASTDAAQCVAKVLEAYPHIQILGDAASYGGDGSEIQRTLKSMLNLTRFVAEDYDALGGDNTAKMTEGLSKLRGILLRGIEQLEDPESPFSSGYKRMLDILSIHDLAKSEAVAAIAETSLGCSDHDMALSVLVQNNFDVLDGVIPDDYLASLRAIIADEKVYDFFSKPRAIAGFNAGRHMQGEAPQQLFINAVKGVDAACIAEFIADWSGVDGHKSLDGPIFLSHIPPAINGTASALEGLLGAGVIHEDMTDVWKEFSYPESTCAQLGLSTETPEGLAIARLAFMGREHQKDVAEAKLHVASLTQAFSELPESMQQQLVAEMNASDLDLGFTPHSIADLRASFLEAGLSEDTEGVTESIYKNYLLTLHRVIDEVRTKKLDSSVITINFESKSKGERLADCINSSKTPEDAVASIEVKLSVDEKGVVAVSFQTASDTEQDWSKTLDTSTDLATVIEGDAILIGGIGGGGDLYQGAALAELLEAHGRFCPAVFSIRRGDVQAVASSLQGATVIDEDNGIVQIHADTTGVIGSSSRLPERGVAQACDHMGVYLIIDNDKGATLEDKIDALAKYVGKKEGIVIDTVVGVDTGGDSLESLEQDEVNQSVSTPDQDHTSLAAITRLDGYKRYSVVVAAGIDSPENFVEVLSEAGAVAYSPTDEEREALVEMYEDTGLGEDESVFSRTSLVYNTILKGSHGQDAGYRYVDGIPLDKRLSRSNPWQSWVRLTESMSALCVMSADEHYRAIGG